MDLVVLCELAAGHCGQLNCIVSLSFLLGILSFQKASVVLHQKLLDALDISMLVVFDVALEELEEMILFAALSIWTPLVRRRLPWPRLLVEVCSLILEASFLILNLFIFLDVRLKCEDAGTSRLLGSQRQFLCIVLASWTQEET